MSTYTSYGLTPFSAVPPAYPMPLANMPGTMTMQPGNTVALRPVNPPEEIFVGPGIGWVTPVPVTFRYVPNERVIVDQAGSPVLQVQPNTRGFILVDGLGKAVAKSSGYTNVWDLHTPSTRAILTKLPNYYDVKVETMVKGLPILKTHEILMKANWGALLPPLETAYIMKPSGVDMALIRNESADALHQCYSITMKENQECLILLLLLCHLADFVLQHCVDVTTKGSHGISKREMLKLKALNRNVKKWEVEPPPSAIVHGNMQYTPFPARYPPFVPQQTMQVQPMMVVAPPPPPPVMYIQASQMISQPAAF